MWSMGRRPRSPVDSAAPSGRHAARLVSLIAEPAGDVEPPRVPRRYQAEVGFQRAQPLGPQDLGPPGAQVVEDARRKRQSVDGPFGEPHDLAPRVARIGPAFGVAELLERVDGLARGLLGDAQPPPKLRRGGSARADGLE